MAKQEKEERLIRDGRISMFVLGTSRWRGRSYRACSLHWIALDSLFVHRLWKTRLIFLLKVSVLNGRGQATSIATRFIYAWSCSPSIGRVQMFKRKSVLLISGPIATGRVDWPCRSSRIKVEIWELPCLRSISLSLSPSTERTTIIIIIISRLSHGGSRFRKVGSRREGGAR